MAQNQDPPKKGGRPPRAGAAADDVLRVRLTAEERAQLDGKAAAAGRSVANHVRAWIAGEEPGAVPVPPAPPAPVEPPYVHARPRPGVEPHLTSRWTPRHVWTLHLVPGRLDGPPLAVRRRVLGDRDDVGHDIETPDGDMHVNFDALQEKGRARGYGSQHADDWGYNLAIDAYDHNPTTEEREDWLRRHRLIQAAIRSPPSSVWVSFAGPRAGGPDRAVKCKAWRGMGDGAGHRTDLHVALPGYTKPKIGEFIRNRLDVDLYDLAVEIAVEVRGEGGTPHAVYLHKPLASQLAADGEERARRAAAEAAAEARAEAAANAFRRPPPAEAPPPPKAEAPDLGNAFASLDGIAALSAFGLNFLTATVEDVQRVYRERAKAGHPDKGGTVDMGKLVRQRDVARAYVSARGGSP